MKPVLVVPTVRFAWAALLRPTTLTRPVAVFNEDVPEETDSENE